MGVEDNISKIHNTHVPNKEILVPPKVLGPGDLNFTI